MPVQESFSDDDDYADYDDDDDDDDNHGKHYCVTEVCGLHVKCVEKHE